ncbi:MAG: hypothetical protein AAGB93_24885 [Planctomycetota bacterium]
MNIRSLLPLLLALSVFAPYSAAQGLALGGGAGRSKVESPRRVVPRLVESLAGSASEGGGWSGNGSPALLVSARAQIAMLADGHTPRRGEHAAILKAAGRWTFEHMKPEDGRTFSPDERAAVALYLGDLNTLEPSVTLRRYGDAWVRAAFAERDESGFLGEGDRRVENTVELLMGAARLRDAGGKVDAAAVEASVAALDSLAHPESGIVTGFEGANLFDRLRDTSAVVVTKLMLGQRPDDDEVLELQVAYLRRSFKSLRKYKASPDVDFWRWTMEASRQLDEELGDAWFQAGWPAVARAAEALGDPKENPDDWDVVAAARIVEAATTPYRYERFLE